MTAPWDTRSPREHDRVAALGVSQWLPIVTSSSEYWSRRAEQIGLEPGSTRSLEDLDSFPSIREGELLASAGGAGQPALVMKPTVEQVKAYGSTATLRSVAGAIRDHGVEAERRAVLTEFKPVHLHAAGSTGQLVISSTRTDLDRMHRCGARAARVLGLTESDCLLNAVPRTVEHAWWAVHHLALASNMLSFHPRPDEAGLQDVLPAIELAPVTVVAVPVHEAVQLAELMAETDLNQVATVVTVGPPPEPQQRSQIREAWRTAGADPQLVVRAVYAPSELRTLWAEPRAEPTGLVTHPDLELLETTEAVTGQPVEEGGDLTVTTLGWHGTALVRYQTGVWVDGIEYGPCPASGYTAPRIVGEVLEQAWQPEVEGPDGAPVLFDFRVAGSLLGRADRVEAWRIEVRGPSQKAPHDRVLVELGGRLSQSEVAALYGELERLAGARPHDIHVNPDPARVLARIDDYGSPFVDRR